MRQALIQQVKNSSFSLIMGQGYWESWFSFGRIAYWLHLQSDTILLQACVHHVRCHRFLFTGQSWYTCLYLGYTLATNPIYSAIDWKSGSSYAWIIASVAIMAIIHFLSQLIWYKCKRPKLEELLEKEGRWSDWSIRFSLIKSWKKWLLMSNNQKLEDWIFKRRTSYKSLNHKFIILCATNICCWQSGSCFSWHFWQGYIYKWS